MRTRVFELARLRCALSVAATSRSSSAVEADWTYVIAFGANMLGSLGALEQALHFARFRLAQQVGCKIRVGPGISTRAVGGGRQSPYLNAVLILDARVAPATLLRFLKRLEMEAGRRQRGLNAARPLDLDILLWRWGVCGVQRRGRRRGQLQVPHPELHKRTFMVVPLSLAVPHWRHGPSGASGRQILAHLQLRAGDGALWGGA